MIEHSKLGRALRKDACGVFWRRVVPHHAANPLNLHEVRFGHGDLMDEKIGTRGVSDQILAVACIAGQHDRFSRVVKAVAEGRLDLVAVIDLETRDTESVAIMDEAIAAELAGLDARAFGKSFRDVKHYKRRKRWLA